MATDGDSSLDRAEFSSVKAVFFDLDDTLCSYWQAAATGLHQTFSEIQIGEFDADTMVGHWAVAFRKFSKTIKGGAWYEGYLKSGEPTRVEQMRLTLLEVGIDDRALAQKLATTYAAKRDAALELFPECGAVLEALHGRYPMGLITNGPADIQNQEIDTLGIRRYFDVILIEGEMGEGKPNQSVFRRAESSVGVQPNEIVFVGNSLNHDMRPAMEAGWKTIWVRRPTDVPPSAKGETSVPEPVPAEGSLPDRIVTDLSSVVKFLST